MDWAKARKAYDTQKRHAKGRGIGWELTFHQWIVWWGDDIDKRGSRPEQLQMQRIADAGPYRLDNIRKGHPKQNAETRGHMERKRNTNAAATLRKAEADAAMFAPSKPDRDELTEDELYLRHLGYTSSRYRQGTFKADK